ncbi:MAG: N-formylglutamate amidohydrolase [Candidatus Aminicenantales bacterium]
MRTGLIVHIPHSSVEIPPNIRQSLLLTDAELERELPVMTDLYTDEVPLDLNSIRIIKAPVSRLVVDVERFRRDEDEPMARFGMGAVYTRTHDGRELRALTEESREEMLRRYFDPHHRNLTAATRDELAEHGRCLIVDVHSFSDMPLPHEKDHNVPRPDICLGTDEFHTPRRLLESASAFFEGHGFSVKENSPFAGTMVPLEFLGEEPSVLSIMVEMNRKWLSDAETGAKKPTAGWLLGLLAEWITKGV